MFHFVLPGNVSIAVFDIHLSGTGGAGARRVCFADLDTLLMVPIYVIKYVCNHICFVKGTSNILQSYGQV